MTTDLSPEEREVMTSKPHKYPGAPGHNPSDPGDCFTSDCEYGCGCWAGPSRSGGPEGVDPFGNCPNHPDARDEVRIGTELSPEGDKRSLSTKEREAMEATWDRINPDRGKGKRALRTHSSGYFSWLNGWNCGREYSKQREEKLREALRDLLNATQRHMEYGTRDTRLGVVVAQKLALDALAEIEGGEFDV